MKQLVFLTIAMFIYSATFAQAVKKKSTTLNQETVVTVEQQPEEKTGWSEFHIGVSFPGGDLGDEDYLGAGTGFGIGLKAYKPLESILPNLSLVYGVDLYYHGLSSDVKDEIEEDGSDIDFTHPMYFNLPVMIGGNYTMPLQNSLCLYGELALGVNCSYMTKTTYKYDSNNKYELSIDPAFGFCYGFEAGIVLNDKFHIGVRYNNLGSNKYKFKETETYDGSSETYKGTTEKIELSNTVLVLGVRF